MPTMGALHKGHLSLIGESKKNCDLSVVSIFVNPTQFSPAEDFSDYPRMIDQDIEKLKNIGADVLFLPTKDSLYQKDFSTYINEEFVSAGLEGKSRPHFFKGVSSVVLKLFNIIKPNVAYFGKKDIQQLKVVQKIVKDLNVSVKIVGVDTVREKSGLAMSSRNQYFSKEKRIELGLIYDALKVGEKEILSGTSNPDIIKKSIKKALLKIKNLKIDYIEIGDTQNLKSLKTINQSAIISLAVWINGTRLIDNIEVNL